jgi:hypothetical protein
MFLWSTSGATGLESFFFWPGLRYIDLALFAAMVADEKTPEAR